MFERIQDRLINLSFRVVWPPPPAPLRYAVAIGVTLGVALVKLLVPASGEQSPHLLLTIPVAVSAVVAGIGPALVATAGATLVILFFLPPALALTVAPGWGVFLAAFLLEGLVIAVLGAALRVALIRSLMNLHRLEELQLERSALVATVSHELRNPLAALSGHLQLATQYVARGRHDLLPRALEVSGAQVSRVLRLTEDLLVIASVTDAPLRVETQLVDLGVAISSAAARAVSEGRPILPVVPEGSVLAMADPARLDQILDNLIGNAVRYAPAGSTIELTVSSDAHARKALVDVRDYGDGVDPHERERIFERFVRGSAARGVAGSGIGLYVSRELARRMGGRLHLRETSQLGSVFTIELPLAPVETVALAIGGRAVE